MHVNLNEKTGFKLVNPTLQVLIKDENGKIFLHIQDEKTDKFNLPPGSFEIETGEIYSPLTELRSPVEYPLIKLPKNERDMGNVFDYEIVFLDKHYPQATINFQHERIKFDKSFKDVERPLFYYVLFHEFAHRYFYNEERADELAYNYMIKKGFNPKQILNAHQSTLSDRQLNRKANLKRKLIEMKMI